MPKEVIKRARKYLRYLEEEQNRPQGGLPQEQADFDFSAPEPPEDAALRNAIDQLDPDSMTPRQALDALYELKKEL